MKMLGQGSSRSCVYNIAIVGARNILSKSMYGSNQSIHWGEIAPLEVVA